MASSFRKTQRYDTLPPEPSTASNETRFSFGVHSKWRYLLITHCLVSSLFLGFLGLRYSLAHISQQPACRTTSFRREWRSLDEQERRSYVQAVQCLQYEPSRLGMNHSLYEDFPYVHGLSAGKGIHEAGSFLAWHRYYLHIYEEALRESCGYKGHVTYWDWTLDWNDMLSAPVWGNNDFSFGTNGSAEASIGQGVMRGSCVVDGPFANMTVHYLNRTAEEHCLSRGFSKESLRHQFQTWLRPAAIESLLLEPRYEEFNIKVEDTAHLAIPGIIQGDFAGFTAPNDPVFFLHHTQLDRLWWLWQRQSPGRLNQYGGALYRGAPPSEENASVDNILRMGGLAPDVRVLDILDTGRGNLCYTYF